jgi:hypothetical protein
MMRVLQRERDVRLMRRLHSERVADHDLVELIGTVQAYSPMTSSGRGLVCC